MQWYSKVGISGGRGDDEESAEEEIQLRKEVEEDEWNIDRSKHPLQKVPDLYQYLLRRSHGPFRVHALRPEES
jgi:hypothetical protein